MLDKDSRKLSYWKSVITLFSVLLESENLRDSLSHYSIALLSEKNGIVGFFSCVREKRWRPLADVRHVEPVSSMCQVFVDPRPSGHSMTLALPAALRRRRRQLSIELRQISSRHCCYWSTGQTDGRTPDCYIEAAYAASVNNKSVLNLVSRLATWRCPVLLSIDVTNR